MWLIDRDVRRFSLVRDRVGSELQEANRQPGRRARSDEVATCLLRHDLPAAVSVRREDRTARNRRRVVVVFCLLVAWWIAGRVTL
jgi:hypothetical protein